MGSDNVNLNFMTDDEPRGPSTAPDVADAYDEWMLAMSSQEKLGAQRRKLFVHPVTARNALMLGFLTQ